MTSWDKFIQDTRKKYILIALKVLNTFSIQTAEDIVQDVYMRMFTKDYKITDLYKIGPRVVINECINYKRHYGRRTNIYNCLELVEEVAEDHDPNLMPMDIDTIIDHLRHRLAPGEFEVIVARAYGYTYRDIAEVRDTTIGTTKSYISRSMKKAKAIADALL